MSAKLVPSQIFAVVPPSIMVLQLNTLEQLQSYCEYLNDEENKEKYEPEYFIQDNKNISYYEYESGYGNSTFRTTRTKVKLGTYVLWKDSAPDKHYYVYLERESYKLVDHIPKPLLENTIVDITNVTAPLTSGDES